MFIRAFQPLVAAVFLIKIILLFSYYLHARTSAIMTNDSVSGDVPDFQFHMVTPGIRIGTIAFPVVHYSSELSGSS